MEKRTLTSAMLNKRAKNTRIANTLNGIATNYGCEVETDHNDNLVIKGTKDNVAKAMELIGAMHNYSVKDGFILDDGTADGMFYGLVERTKATPTEDEE